MKTFKKYMDKMLYTNMDIAKLCNWDYQKAWHFTHAYSKPLVFYQCHYFFPKEAVEKALQVKNTYEWRKI
jgi:hypothetical protein